MRPARRAKIHIGASPRRMGVADVTPMHHDGITRPVGTVRQTRPVPEVYQFCKTARGVDPRRALHQ